MIKKENSMQNNVEYQIFIGCSDSQSRDEIISEENLRKITANFFEREKIDFTMLSAKGGYRHNDGTFITENTLCINIIGATDLDIIKLTKSLSMFMNQERSLIVKNKAETKFS